MPARLNLGPCRRRIAIQSVSLTPTDSGETTSTATTVCTRLASIEPLSGRELMIAKSQQDTTTHRIRCLYYPGITPAMQAVYGTRVFNFASVSDVDELHRELEIMATEVLP